MLPRGTWAGTGSRHAPHNSNNCSWEHPSCQGVQVLDELLDSKGHFRITWDAYRWAVGTVPWVWLLLHESLETGGPCPGPSLGTPLSSHTPHAQVEGSRGLTCFEFFQLFLQPVPQRKHLVIQATGWRGGHSAPCDCSHPPPSSLRAQQPSLHTLSLRVSYQLAVLACDFPPQLSVMLSFLASCHLENSGISLHPTPPQSRAPFMPVSPWEFSAWTSAAVFEVKLLKPVLRVCRSLWNLKSDRQMGQSVLRVIRPSLRQLWAPNMHHLMGPFSDRTQRTGPYCYLISQVRQLRLRERTESDTIPQLTSDRASSHSHPTTLAFSIPTTPRYFSLPCPPCATHFGIPSHIRWPAGGWGPGRAGGGKGWRGAASGRPGKKTALQEERLSGGGGPGGGTAGAEDGATGTSQGGGRCSSCWWEAGWELWGKGCPGLWLLMDQPKCSDTRAPHMPGNMCT